MNPIYYPRYTLNAERHATRRNQRHIQTERGGIEILPVLLCVGGLLTFWAF